MTRTPSLTRSLYKAARASRTVQQVSRGRGASRAVNLAKGRALAKAGVWRRLWR